MEILHFDNEIQERWKDLHCKMSFAPFLRYFKNRREKENSVRRKIYDYIINSFEACPHLLEPFEDVEQLKNYKELIELLQMSLLPVAGTYDHEPIGFGTIFPTRFFYYTDGFKQLLQHENAELAVKKVNDDINTIRFYYALILEKCYGVKTDFSNHKIIRFDDTAKHTIEFHKLETDTQFIDVKPIGKLPAFNKEWQNMLCGSNKDFIRLTELLPASRFSVEGFTVFFAQNVTAEEALNQLKNVVLNLHDNQEEASLNEVENILGILLGDTRIKIGMAPFFKVNNEVVTDTDYFEKAILISTLDQCPNDKINPKTASEKFSKTYEPIIFPEVDKKIVVENPVLKGLLTLKIGSYMIMPVRGNGGMILGALELATEHKKGITRSLLPRLEPALNLIADVLEFMISQFEEKIRNVIKERFTPLQPSVEWKFNEAAWQFVRSKSDADNQLPNVVFEDVFPLYGAIDIRNSSVERNKAAQVDLIAQLKDTQKMISAIRKKVDFPFLEGLYYKSGLQLEEIQSLYTAETEQKIRDFFSLEIYPTFKHLQEGYEVISAEIKHYINDVDAKKGQFHLHGRLYEQSLQKVNKTINQYLENERAKQHLIYPHYFEKYRTDGVEYTLYIGQSLKPKKPFNPIYLKNLRMWQLTSMAHIGHLTLKVSADMEIPLKTTQLILAHNLPIAISFRKDERRFDVEGSYNIRYEVMKKRIDKIEIRDTGERLTKPNHVAIVYSQATEADEYKHHLDFLVNKGLFLPDYEQLELEDMQGVSGLKAFRAAINYAHFEPKKTLKAKPESYVR